MQLPLNLKNETYRKIELGVPSAKVEYYPDFLKNHLDIFDELREDLIWSQDQITMYGKTHNVPRLQAWYAEDRLKYSYSGIELQPFPLKKSLLQLKNELNERFSLNLNSVLCNLYRSGDDYVAWHSDNEKELGDEPVICSLSLGESRKFIIRNKINREDRRELVLNSGDLLIMSGTTQELYEHQVSRTRKKVGERINLTFRKIVTNK